MNEEIPPERSEGPPQAGRVVEREESRYSLYLASPLWKKKRAGALQRDKGRCRACSEPATVVHHIRYPKVLGEEPPKWLYSLCAPCHDTIHYIVERKKVSIRIATLTVLGEPPKPKPKKAKKKKSKRTWAAHTERPPKKATKKAALVQDNERLRILQARAQARRSPG